MTFQDSVTLEFQRHIWYLSNDSYKLTFSAYIVAWKTKGILAQCSKFLGSDLQREGRRPLSELPATADPVHRVPLLCYVQKGHPASCPESLSLTLVV